MKWAAEYDFHVAVVSLLGVLPLILNCSGMYEGKSREGALLLPHAGKLRLVDQIPLQFPTHHVQGLDLSDQYYFVTSVDRERKRGWLFLVDRQSASLAAKMELTDGSLIHPGGLQFDGQTLWIPNAEYRRESRTMIYAVNPQGLEIPRSFPVDDHIGAIASDGENRLFGVNWDARHFYTWDFDGLELGKVDSPTDMAYQDIKYVKGKLLCSGHNDRGSALDVIDPESWQLESRIDLPREAWKSRLSREGMAFDGNLYFLPDDGPNSHILIFALE